MTINMNAPNKSAEWMRESLSKILKSKPHAAIIFCQELPGYFKNKVVPKGYDSVKTGRETAIMWDTNKFKTPNEESKKEHERQRIAIKKARDHLPGIVSMVKLKHKPCMGYYIRYSREIKYERLIYKNYSDKHRPCIAESSIVSDGVNENVLSFCQSTNRESSNACTIIAVLAAIDFLSGTGWFSLTSAWGLSFPDYCYKLFNKGNQMYDSLDVGQTNYSAPDILEHENLGLKNIAERGDEYQFDRLDALLSELPPMGHKLAFVLIFHPDKSMVLLINEHGVSMLIDSHLHLNIGAIVATASQNKLEGMIKYIKNMIKRDWGLKVSKETPFDVTIVKLK